MHSFLKYLSYRAFCLAFFLFFFFIFYYLFKWFLLGDDNEYLAAYSFIGSTAVYFSAGMTRRRKMWKRFKEKFDLPWLLFLILFRFVIALTIWAILCLAFEIADRTVFYSFFNQSLAEAYGFRWLLIVTVVIEAKYHRDRMTTIKSLYNKYFKPKP